MTRDPLVMVRGGGDLGTGAAHRLATAGYRVIVLERGSPRVVRRRAAFAEAVFSGETVVEGVVAVRVSAAELHGGEREVDRHGPWVPVAVDPEGELVRALRPDVVLDARMAKRNLGTRIDDAPLTLALGPGFEAGRDVDLVIETARGGSMGAVIESGAALPDTGVPGEVAGASAGRLIRSPADGVFTARREIGDAVAAGDVVGEVLEDSSRSFEVTVAIGGVIRGLLADGLDVRTGDKLGDVDPRGAEIDPALMSDKARAVGEAVLEALRARGLVPVE